MHRFSAMDLRMLIRDLAQSQSPDGPNTATQLRRARESSQDSVWFSLLPFSSLYRQFGLFRFQILTGMSLASSLGPIPGIISKPLPSFLNHFNPLYYLLIQAPQPSLELTTWTWVLQAALLGGCSPKHSLGLFWTCNKIKLLQSLPQKTPLFCFPCSHTIYQNVSSEEEPSQKDKTHSFFMGFCLFLTNDDYVL